MNIAENWIIFGHTMPIEPQEFAWSHRKIVKNFALRWVVLSRFILIFMPSVGALSMIPASGFTSIDLLQENLHFALRVSDEYVWLYNETGSWCNQPRRWGGHVKVPNVRLAGVCGRYCQKLLTYCAMQANTPGLYNWHWLAEAKYTNWPIFRTIHSALT